MKMVVCGPVLPVSDLLEPMCEPHFQTESASMHDRESPIG
jgi:hypothetical protein